MELENIKVIGVITVDNKVNLMLAVKDSTDWWSAEVFTNKTGKYIKILGAHFKDRKDIPDLNKKKNFYINDDLWWAVYRFEKHLEKENGCAPTQPK